LETIYAKEVITENPQKPCNTCKKSKLNKNMTAITIFGTYILFSAIYGNYVIIKNLIDFIFG
jgi:hypothetical protein